MGKGSGGCSRPALQLGGDGAGSIGGIHPSVPVALRGYLEETDEEKLVAALSTTTSFPEHQTIVFRLAQLREEHAVAGLMSSAAYKKAKKSYAIAERKLADARAALESAESTDGWAPTDEELLAIERRIFGGAWRERVAEDALAAHPEWIALERELASPRKPRKAKGAPDIEALDKQMKLALVRKGPLSPEVRALRAELKAAKEASDRPEETLVDAETRRGELRARLLGTPTPGEDGLAYEGVRSTWSRPSPTTVSSGRRTWTSRSERSG